MELSNKTNQAINRVKSLLKRFRTLGHTCLLCQENNSRRMCRLCEAYLPVPQHPCQRCSIPLPHKTPYCGSCLKKPPYFDDTFSPYLFETPMDALIYDFKHKGHELIGLGLAELFSTAIQAHYLRQHLSLPDKLVAVPIHWSNQWQRCFNQSEILSDKISKRLGMPVFNTCKRVRKTPKQQGLNKKERLKNLKGCFKVYGELEGQSIAIVDDVMTSGATANTLAQELKRAGAGHVSVWALARTPLP